MIDRIEHVGKFLHECSLPGEGRDLNIFPAHPNAIQLAADRWMLLYSTRAYRGDDDEKSGIYQLRKDGIDGPVLKEGWICRTRDDWDALGDGRKYVRQHGHPVAFGVPRGALVGGRRVPHENVFGVCWRLEARYLDPATGFMQFPHEHPELTALTRSVDWVQFRLNDAGDDIEVLQPPRKLRQRGYESGPQFCRHELRSMSQAFVPHVPLDAQCSQWVVCNHVTAPARAAVMPLRFAFNAQRGLYEWVESGPLLGEDLFEASIAPWRGGFVIAARRQSVRNIAWMRTSDPFGSAPAIHARDDQPNWFPLCLYTCPDGALRRTGGCVERSAYQSGRNPIYLVDIDPDRDFAATAWHEVYDGVKAGLPMQHGPLVDFPKLVPHAGGRVQWVLHRARSMMLNNPARPHQRLRQEEIDASGIYAAKVHYTQELPPAWSFDTAAARTGDAALAARA